MRPALRLLALMPLLIGGPALAGRISSLAVSATTVTQHQPVTITVGHEGSKCGYMLATGVGPPQGPKLLTGPGATLSVTYPQTGVFTVNAWGKKKGDNAKCQVGAGVQPVNVTVQASVGGKVAVPPGVMKRIPKEVAPGVHLAEALCVMAGNCLVPVATEAFELKKPHIEAMWFGPVTPGVDVAVFGTNFGEAKPTLHMELLQIPNVDLEVFDWDDNFVAGRIPPTISGVQDQPAKFYVRRAGGIASNKFPRQFTAAREVKMLPNTSVVVLSCGSMGSCDRCNMVVDQDDLGGSCGEVLWMEPYLTVKGTHHNWWGNLNDDRGWDTYKIDLKNDWVLEDYDFNPQISEAGEAWATGPEAFPEGTDFWQPTIAWNASPADWVSYRLVVYISGPKGTSH